MAAKKPGTGKANTKAKAPAKAAPAAKAPASKPPSAKPAPVKAAKPAAKAPAAPAAKASAAAPRVAPVDRQRLIAETAYFLAETRGFRPGNALEDWLAAERSVDARLRG